MEPSPEMRTHIGAVLAGIERSEGVRILFAAESGSRAWGFGSADSDYDVRFIYARPPEWYLRLTDGRDVIEQPQDGKLVDLAGWDVRKALRLLLKSNPALYEWLCSPIVYAADCSFTSAAKSLFERHCSRNAVAHHYHAIATGQWRRGIEGRDHVKLKKYFYVIRPLLSLGWVARHEGPPPMELSSLITALGPSPGLRRTIEDLRIKKLETPQMGLEPRIAVLDAWVLAELARLDPAHLALPGGGGPETEAEADRLFQASIAS